MFFWGPLLEFIGPLREVLYLNKQLQCDLVPKILSGSVLNGTNWGEAEMRDRSRMPLSCPPRSVAGLEVTKVQVRLVELSPCWHALLLGPREQP